ncbi:MAG: hypothetical protein BGO07_01525 [Alphaproteobacteria bacterium 40-19]|nr:MAG: hypothetical protein BGO07_01525 [Alphaproteobacteria bacterium 40-19]
MNKLLFYFWALCLASCGFARVPPGDIGVSTKLKDSQELRSFQMPTFSIPADNTYTVQELSNKIQAAVAQYLVYAEEGSLMYTLFFDPELMQEGIERFSEFWADSSAPDKIETWKNYTFTYNNDPRKKSLSLIQKTVLLCCLKVFLMY